MEYSNYPTPIAPARYYSVFCPLKLGVNPRIQLAPEFVIFVLNVRAELLLDITRGYNEGAYASMSGMC